MLSDSESSDSDNGIRFKTASTRNKEDSYNSTAPTSKNNGNRHDGGGSSGNSNWRSSRQDDRNDRDYQRKRSDGRSSRRSESRERDRKSSSNNYRSDSRDRQNNSNYRSSDRRRSRSRDRIRSNNDVDRKREEKSHRNAPTEVTRSVSMEKPIVVSNHIAEKTTSPAASSVDKHKAKRSKHKKHKRSKREDEKDDESKEREIPKMDQKITRKSATPQPVPLGQTLEPADDPIDDNNSMCGPKLPPNYKPSRSSSSEKRSASQIMGPSLPPTSAQRATSSSSSSSTSRKNDRHTSNSSSERHRKPLGPVAPPAELLEQQDNAMSDISETEDDYLIGPIPDGAHKTEAHLELEKRALELKLAKFNETIDDNLPVREDWMIELPEVKTVANLGLTARQFRTKERPDLSDRSSWTDTPKEKERKVHGKSSTVSVEEVKLSRQKEAKDVYNARRDAEQEDAARKHRKKHRRDESLLDIHQKKLKKKKDVSVLFF